MLVYELMICPDDQQHGKPFFS